MKNAKPLGAIVEGISPLLRELHHTLIQVARAQYEAKNGPIANAGILLNLLVGHPEFSWLRELSKLMADIDELLDNEVITETDAMAVRFEVEKLISPKAGDKSTFATQYKKALQNVPEVVMAHAAVRKVTGKLPATPKKDLARIGQSRQTWVALRTKK